ncbi:MAG: precorrin-3B C(17)-methyltransferase [Lachnospiraceae bacterium]|nr:precorrin-3B C(17)-methyltransferase [Lachnospiraceae bacterium]
MKKLYVVGIGPGSQERMTGEAVEALRKSEILVGYTLYADLVRDFFPDKVFVTTGMRAETERCRRALELSAEDKVVSVLCSGDAGVYGMAGLIYELSSDFPEVEIQVVAGVTAALSGGAILGAPLGHDFAVISLSDLLTPWDKIEKRLRLASEADLAICLYNPGSHHRRDYLQRAVDLLLETKDGTTVCGYVRNIAREGESACVLTLRELRDVQADMLMTVFIGNSQTVRIAGHMVTPRGYPLDEKKKLF